MPTHRLLDAAYEQAKGKNKVGTTGKGIGPTYTDKVSRNGLRVGDIFDNFEEKYNAHKARHEQILKSLNYTDYDISDVEKKWMEGIEYIRQFHIVDSEHVINKILNLVRIYYVKVLRVQCLMSTSAAILCNVF